MERKGGLYSFWFRLPNHPNRSTPLPLQKMYDSTNYISGMRTENLWGEAFDIFIDFLELVEYEGACYY